jgi:hypothetical protein
MRHPLLWIIVPGLAVILTACVYSSGGAASISIYRELGIDTRVSAAVAPASAPSAPSAQAKEK